MRRFLIALSGARPEVLERCPTEYGKFEGIGGAVLTTSVLAVVSMTFALNSALGVNLFLAIVASLLWGLAILSLDRWLVSTLHADASLRHRLFTALPRFLMALLLGFVISTPLVLQIFKGEIDAQMVEIKQHRADLFAAQQKQGDVGKDVARLREEVADLEKVIASGGYVPTDPAQDPKIKALTQDRANEQNQAERHYKEWQCQLYGGPSCPKTADGSLAQYSKRAYETNKQRIAQLNRQIEQRKKELAQNDEAAKPTRLADAQEALPKTRAELDAALKRQADLRASFDAENLAADGVLIRVQALNEVTGTDPALSATRLLLFLLFLVIECLPVTVKLMQRPGNYEKVLALVQRHEFRDARGSLTPDFTQRPTTTPTTAESANGAGDPAAASQEQPRSSDATSGPRRGAGRGAGRDAERDTERGPERGPERERPRGKRVRGIPVERLAVDAGALPPLSRADAKKLRRLVKEMGLTDQERPPWHEKTALEIMLAWNSWNSAAQEAFLAFPWLYRPPLDAIPPDPKDAVAVLSPSSPSIGLLNVVNDQHAPVAAATIANGLNRLFHRLGPPPDSLDAHRSGPIDGDGGAAR